MNCGVLRTAGVIGSILAMGLNMDDVSLGDTRPESELQLKAQNSGVEAFLARCKVAGLTVEKTEYPDDIIYVLKMRCGREYKRLLLTIEQIERILSIPFEKYSFLLGFEAICCFEEGFIEASVRSLGFAPAISFRDLRIDGENEATRITFEPSNDTFPKIELSPPSVTYKRLNRLSARRLTLKLTGCHISNHDEALSLLKRTADTVFFQIDLLSNSPLALERVRKRPRIFSKPKNSTLPNEVQYPKTEFDEAPLSLYWYGRSASGMPLLQFLAFYQAIVNGGAIIDHKAPRERRFVAV
jgi:hypothetical protein